MKNMSSVIGKKVRVKGVTKTFNFYGSFIIVIIVVQIINSILTTYNYQPFLSYHWGSTVLLAPETVVHRNQIRYLKRGKKSIAAWRQSFPFDSSPYQHQAADRTRETTSVAL